MIKTDKILLILAWIILAAAASLLRFKTALQSDALFLDALATDLFNHAGAWSDWKFPRAPSFFPDMLLYFSAFPLLPNAASRIFAVSASQVFLLGGVSVWFARRIYPALSRAAMAAIILIVAFITVVAAKSGMWLYFYSTNNHIAILLAGLPMLVLCLRFLEHGERRIAVLLVVLGAVATISTGLFTLGFTVPALLLLLLSLPAQRDKHRQRRAAELIAWLVLAQFAAWVTSRMLIHHLPVEGDTPANPDTISASFRMFILATKSAFSMDNRYTFGLSLLVTLAALWLAWRLLRTLAGSSARHGTRFDSTESVTAIAAFLLATLPITVLGAIISASFVDPNCYRYFMLPIALLLLLAVIALDQQRRLTPRAMAVPALAVLAGVWTATRHPSLPNQPERDVAACVEAIENQGFALKAGVADYWNARGVSAWLPAHNPFMVTLNQMEPLFWVSSMAPMSRPAAYPEYKYNFVIVRNADAGGQFAYTPETIGTHLPAPSRIHACANTPAQVWLYEDDRLDQAMRASIAGWLHRQVVAP